MTSLKRSQPVGRALPASAWGGDPQLSHVDGATGLLRRLGEMCDTVRRLSWLGHNGHRT